jgi:DNA-binding CsgD family transcriptional regulator
VALLFSDVLLERETELWQLGIVLDQALDRRGSFAVLCGPAGIGKTRLLTAACEEAGPRGMQVLTARGSDLEQRFAYGAVRQLFERFEIEVAGGVGPVDLRGPAAYAAPVFRSLDLVDSSAAPMDRSDAVLHGLYSLACRLSDGHPVLLAIDDAHWLDVPSLLFLGYLARRIGRLPLAIVMTFRSGASGTEAALVRRIAADARARLLELRRLSVGASAEIVRSLLGPGAGTEFCDACHVVTGGNPFLLHELATALVAERRPLSESSAVHVERLVPEAVSRHVLVRLSRLAPSSIRVAHAVAVLGASAELPYVAALAELDVTDAAACIDALVSADILSHGPPLDFLHPLLRETVYQDMGPGERTLTHARAARMLADGGSSAERVAIQLLASEQSPPEWAVDTLRLAAKEAMARGAPTHAVRFLELAIAGSGAVGDKDRLLIELGVAESRAGYVSATDHLCEALQIAGEPRARAEVALELAALYNLLGRFSESASVLEQAIDSVGDSEPELSFSLQAEAAVLGVTVLEGRRRLRPRMADFRARVAALVTTPYAAPLLAVIAEDLTEAEGTAEEVVRCADRAFADGKLLAREGPVLVIGASALIMADKPTQADAILEAAIAKADSRGSLNARRLALAFRAYARNRLGRIAEAEADASLSLELSSEQPSDPVWPFKVAQLAEALVEQGDLVAAEKLLAPVGLTSCDRDSKLFQPLANIQARLSLLRGRADDALILLQPQLQWMKAWCCHNSGWTSARSLAALAHGALGKTRDAQWLADEDLEAALSFGAPRDIGIALRTKGLVGAEPQIASLRESADVLEESESRLELARTLMELGSALRRVGRRGDARKPLRRGLEIASDCGGVLVADRARAELLATGARPRRVQLRGPDALTASERRVAVLAKEGLSNREIARELFLSTKTVEMHLSHAYRKLEIHSRVQLGVALTEAHVAERE